MTTGRRGTAEHVSTVTVEITNGKTFAVDQTVTLTFSGTATQGTHYSVTPGDADTNTAGHQVVLRTGDSSVEVTVTATGNDTADRNRTVTVAADLDGTAIGSTDITILDDEDTNDATLSALALSGVTLAPTFVSSTETYTATVGNAVTETTVTATPTHSGATVAFKDGADNALTNPVTLAEGANVIKAVVTAADTTTMKTYMVTVTRAATAPAIVTGGVRATSMPLVGDTYGLGETIKITVTFDKAVTVDTSGGKPRIRSVLNGGGTPVDGWAEYSSGSGGTALVFTYTVQAGDMDDDGIWLPANSLELQGGTIRDAADTTVDATLTYAQPGTQSEHKVDGGPTLSDDATLSALALSGVTLDPTFASATEDYTATVGNAVTETTVTATPTHSGATVAFKDGADNALTNPVTLAVGANVIKAVVTAEDTTTMKTYMVTVTREDTTSTCLTPNLAGRMQIWTGTVTVGAYEDGGTVFLYGFGPGFGALDDTQFRVGTNDYTVDRAQLHASASTLAGRLEFSLTSALAAADSVGLTLHVCDAAFAFADAGLSLTPHTYGWASSGLDWSSDTSRTLYLSVPSDTTTAPEIVTGGVQVTSTPMATGDPYGLGETIKITVTFDNAVTVDTSGGTPRIEFRLDGALLRWAVYSSGSGGTALVFTYKVQADDMDDDGIWLPADVLQLQGGTIRDATDTTVDATLTYARPGLQSGHEVDGSLTTPRPVIVTDGVQVTSTPMATADADTYGLGETIAITVTFDKPVTVDTSGGTRRPGIAFRLDGDLNPNRWAGYSSGSGGTALVFTYKVQAGDMDTDGIRLPANSIELFRGTIVDATDTIVDATLTYAEPGLQSGHEVDGSLTTTTNEDDGTDEDDGTTTTPPAIVTGGVQVTSTPMATADADTYGLGETIAITVTFDKAVTVDTSGGTRRPGIAFRLDGDLNPNRWAGYSSGSGGTALVFTYMVQAGDMDDYGIRLPANSIELFGGTIRDATDTIVDATLTYAQPGIQNGHKVDGSLTTTTNEDDGTMDDDDGTTSPPTGTGGGGGGGGSSGPSLTVPGAPSNLLLEVGDGQVTLTWDAPEDDGGSAITDYEYRINGQGEWISIGSTDTTHTVTGLDNDTVYTFQVRAVNRIGRSQPSSDPTEATPRATVALDFAHFANGTGITSDLVFVNVSPHMTRPALYFYDQQGHLIDPESVVEVTADLEIQEDGGLTVQTEMDPLGVLTISTHGRGELVSGSARVVSDGPIGGGLRYNFPAIGEAVVGASPPVGDALFPVRRQEGGITTGVALHNLESSPGLLRCDLMREGVLLDSASISLEANGQTSWMIDQAFPAADTSDFAGSVRCAAPGRGRFTAIAVEMDAAQRIFTTLSVVPLDRTGGGNKQTTLNFAHFVNGTWITDLVFVNLSSEASRPAPTPFHTAIPPSRPVIYFYDTEGNPIAAESVVDITGDLEIAEDGALTVRTEMEPLGVLTISTHGRGELVSGSARVVSEGPIGGMLRFEHPALGVAGVGANPPVGDVLFPVRRQEGGITTGVALHNLESSPGLLRCDLMREGVLRDSASIPLQANGQTSWLIDQAFPAADTSDFAGSVRCDAVGEGLFSAVALEMDPGNRIFTTLPVVPVPEMPDRE